MLVDENAVVSSAWRELKAAELSLQTSITCRGGASVKLHILPRRLLEPRAGTSANWLDSVFNEMKSADARMTKRPSPTESTVAAEPVERSGKRQRWTVDDIDSAFSQCCLSKNECTT